MARLQGGGSYGARDGVVHALAVVRARSVTAAAWVWRGAGGRMANTGGGDTRLHGVHHGGSRRARVGGHVRREALSVFKTIDPRPFWTRHREQSM